MRYSIRLLLAITVLFVASENHLLSQEYLEFRKDDFSIKYPSYFDLDTTGIEGSVFVLSTQKSDENDVFVENINLSTQPSKTDFDTFIKKTESQISEVAEIIESKMINARGKSYKRMVFRLQSNGVDLTFIQHIYDHGTKIYALTFTSETAEFDSYFDEVDKVFMSFKLL